MMTAPDSNRPSRSTLVPGSRRSFEIERERLWGELKALRSAAAEELGLRRELGALLLVTVALLAVAQASQSLIHADSSPRAQMGFSWGLLLLLLVPVLWFVRVQPLPLSRLGVTLRGAGASLREGLVVVAVLAVGFALWRGGALLRGEAPWVGGSVGAYSAGEKVFFFLAYGPHCALQEFVARGVLQTSLTRLLPWSSASAGVLVTSVLFGVFHLYVSPGFALLTFVVSACLGFFYARHRTLVGVTFVHTSLGLLSVAVGLN